jgi:hypothetical protein
VSTEEDPFCSQFVEDQFQSQFYPLITASNDPCFVDLLINHLGSPARPIALIISWRLASMVRSANKTVGARAPVPREQRP